MCRIAAERNDVSDGDDRHLTGRTQAPFCGRTAVAQSCLAEVLGIFAKLPSGYQRDLQLIKPPLFRGIDLALATAHIMTVGIDGVRFRDGTIKLDPSIHAAEEANALVVREGIPFREAYRRVADKYLKK